MTLDAPIHISDQVIHRQRLLEDQYLRDIQEKIDYMGDIHHAVEERLEKGYPDKNCYGCQPTLDTYCKTC